MKKLSPAMIETLVAVAREAESGAEPKGAVYARACERLHMSQAKLYRLLNAVTVRPARKRRSDAGAVALTRGEAEQLGGYLVKHIRGNGKQSISLKKAVDDLRANGLIRAERVDPATGEITPLTPNTIARALRQYGFHPEQLRRAAPAVQQKSLYPNHVWQMDASVCTLFYLEDDGTRDMPAAVFYKNKPENFERVAKQRVTRFVITDHTSGTIKVRYALGSESVANYSEFFFWAMHQHGHTAMHGVPHILMVDPGSGMKGAFGNLVRRLDIRLIVDAPGNPRAKGQVENAQNLVELGFESQFRAQRPHGLAELNERAQVWMDHFNASAVHTRHNATRDQKWLEITADQLRAAPALPMLRQLLTADDKPCRVTPFMQVQFGGGKRFWDVRGVPGVVPGEKLAVTWNAYNDREVFVVLHGADGQEQLIACPLVETDANGFSANAIEIGSGYRALPDTDADKRRKAAEQIAAGGATHTETERLLRRADVEVMGGRVRFDHLAHELDAMPVNLPRRGEVLQPATQLPATEPAPERALTFFEVAQALTAAGVRMTPERVALVRQWHPQGLKETELQALQQRLTVRAGLRVVGSDAANP